MAGARDLAKRTVVVETVSAHFSALDDVAESRGPAYVTTSIVLGPKKRVLTIAPDADKTMMVCHPVDGTLLGCVFRRDTKRPEGENFVRAFGSGELHERLRGLADQAMSVGVPVALRKTAVTRVHGKRRSSWRG